jgi:predicted lysophospholipase L1 biosynthesis ABC-type transport system permease subunit
METEAIIGLVLGIAIGAVILVVFGFILQWLWNSTLPDVLGVNQVTTWQAIKIMFIASMLFGGHRAVGPDDAGIDTAGAAEAAAGVAIPE